MDLITRESARALNLKRYFTGTACPKGHVAERLVSNCQCVTCGNEKNRRRAAANPERHARKARDWRASNRPRLRAIHRRHRGLPEPTRPEPDACECCGSPSRTRALALDHDHETGAFRGWLCFDCNTGIGRLGDSIPGIQRALDYLSRKT